MGFGNVFGDGGTSAWHAVGANTAFYCATSYDPVACNGQVPPLDATGNIQLDPDGYAILYWLQGAFSTPVLAVSTSATRIVGTSTAGAELEVPLFQTPFDPTSAPLTPLDLLVPNTPKQASSGITLMTSDGQQHVVPLGQLDLSGPSQSAIAYYDAVPGATDGSIELFAAWSSAPLYQLELCFDPVSPSNASALIAGAFTPASTVLAWINAHPTAAAACGLTVRNIAPSCYGNCGAEPRFPSFARGTPAVPPADDNITSTTNHIRLGIVQIGGYDRIVDVMVYAGGI